MIPPQPGSLPRSDLTPSVVPQPLVPQLLVPLVQASPPRTVLPWRLPVCFLPKHQAFFCHAVAHLPAMQTNRAAQPIDSLRPDDDGQ